MQPLRELGFTAGVIAPSKGIIRGTSALVALGGENPNDSRSTKPRSFKSRARFSDAEFFWDADQKTPLRERLSLAPSGRYRIATTVSLASERALFGQPDRVVRTHLPVRDALIAHLRGGGLRSASARPG